MEDYRGTLLSCSRSCTAADQLTPSQKLLETRKDTDLTPILTFQAHLVASLHQTFITRVDEDFYPLFDDIWAASEIKDAVDSYRWRRLGFRTESPQYEFDGTGVLGLKALARYAGDSQNEFATVRSAILWLMTVCR